jgi:NAD-dependent deacetylase
MDSAIDAIAQRMRDARHVLVLTGAGVSAESGVPTFREAQTGLWAKYDPLELATPEAFAESPERVWAWYRWRKDLVRRAQPNPAHRAIARWQRVLPRLTVVTQNVDGLHQAAGLDAPIELHGSLASARCAGCGERMDWDAVPTDALPRHTCGALLRPDIVWFGEGLPQAALDSAMDAARGSELCLAIGTSGVVYPAAAIPQVAAQSGAFLVEINPQSTPLSAHADLHLKQPAGEALTALDASLQGLDRGTR